MSPSAKAGLNTESKLFVFNEKINSITNSLKDVLAYDMDSISSAASEYSGDKLGLSRQIIMVRQGINALLSIFPEEKKSANHYTVSPSEYQKNIQRVIRKFLEELRNFNRAIGLLLIDGRDSIVELMHRNNNPHHLKHFLGQLINIDKTIEDIQKAVDPEGYKVSSKKLNNSSNGGGEDRMQQELAERIRKLDEEKAEEARKKEELEAQQKAEQEAKAQAEKDEKGDQKPDRGKPHLRVYNLNFRVPLVREIAHEISDRIKSDKTGDPNISFDQLLNILNQKRRDKKISEKDLTFHLNNLRTKLEFQDIKLEGEFKSGGKTPIYYTWLN